MKRESFPNCNILEFHPYNHIKYLFVMFIFMACGTCFLAYYLDNNFQNIIGLLFLASCILFSAFHCLCFISVRIRIDDHGITLENTLLGQHKQYKWAQFRYGYYVANSKAKEHLLLSPNQLHGRELKSVLRHSMRIFPMLSAKRADSFCLPIPLNWHIPNLKADIEGFAYNHIDISAEDGSPS